jgi:hypothetical protein
MFTKNIKDTFTASLLSAVSGVLGEAKKKPCSEGCECEACVPEEDTNEGYMPTNDMPSDKDRKTAGKLGALLKREREAKEKKEPNGVKTEEVEDLDEKRGLWDNIHAKRERIKAGSGERMRKPGSKGAPSAADLKASQTEEVQIDENEQYVEITNAHTNSKSYVPVHKTQAYAALNHYNSFSHNKRVRIIDKKEHDAIHAAKAAGVKEAWDVKKGTEVVSSHKTKDEADVKAMKNPLNKVVAKESIDEAFEQIDEISSDMAHRYLKGKHERDYDTSADGKSSKLKKPQTFAKMNKDMKSTARALRTIEKAKKTNEEVEQVDEISKPTLGRYINKAKNSIDLTAWRQGHKEADINANPKHVASLGKKLDKRHRGIETAVKKLTKEDAEQIDELSKDTMGRYINKAATKMGSQGVTAGLKIAADEKSSKNFKDMGKREKGIKLAVSKLTKEEQDFIDSLNDADMEQIDELSKDAMLNYLHANKHKNTKDGNPRRDLVKSMRGTDMAVRKYTAKPGSKSVRVPATEEVELDEARGRPKKAGARDFTVHPKTKEKLMHNNPAHMAKIERLQKNGILPKPKTEANQHIIQQLQRAKLSMRGGETVNFTHGDPTHVSGTHASKLLDKYAGMKPDEKESFQKKIGHSHANLKSEL